MTTTPTRPTRPRAPQDFLKKSEVDEALDEGLRITLDGETYELRMGDVTSALTRELRAKSGMSFSRLMSLVVEDPDTDVIAAFIWVARRVRGDDVEFDDIEIAYRDLLSDGFQIGTSGAEEVDGSPEA